MTSKADKVDKRVAAVLLTSRYIMYAVGRSRGNTLADLKVSLDLTDGNRFNRIECDLDDPEDIRDGISAAASAIREQEQNIDGLCVASCRYLKSNWIDDKTLTTNNYGVIEHSAISPSWADTNLFQIASEVFSGVVDPRDIFVQTDVNLGALGEFYFRLAANCFSDSAERQRLRAEGFTKRSIKNYVGERAGLAFIKLSDTVDASVCIGGKIIQTTANPLFGWQKPRRLFFDGERDTFLGTCDVHGDCYSGMISEGAIKARLNEIDIHVPYHELPEGDAMDHIVAYYAAQMVKQINLVFFPRVVVVGGRLVEDRRDSGKPTCRDLSTLIYDSFLEQIRPDFDLGRYPNHADICRLYDFSDRLSLTGEPAKFVQSALCPYPVVFGAIVYAARKSGSQQGDSK